jgi:transposase
MSCVFKKRNKCLVLKKAKKIHGIMRCHDHGYFHRDKNAAVNIMDIYENLVSAKERPVQFRPVRGSRFT